MAEALRFFGEYEATIYFVLAIGVIFYSVKFWGAWMETRKAFYGLEQVSARRRLNQAAISIFILVVMGFTIFMLVSFVSPVIAPEIVLPISSPVPGTAETLVPEENEEALLATATPLPTVSVSTEGCIPGVLEITSPEPGSAISGQVPVEGSVNVPDFGFFKFEVAEAQQELWLTVQAGRTIIEDGVLVENWDTSLLPPGEYVLQLVATESDGDVLPACRIPIRIGAAQ